ncbi:brefeldin A-inhibited guanine nucleotide-exchange protein 3 isoform X10 [Canis lupus familiaris]|uniref:brefeldin A-inhibited guanine nucleotide-exchange protein 3 isoform X1 n=1 Tax=Canis lupus dingo TaxID=286419 RepID=UPI000DC68FB0|nr:brefeldin A-inhibited guanine nucleotide-exchange protein 3 isoform X1 [Canis lupus dingo]XP_038382065.1 brefeldin A-inhibited guanine nucleotide-exchange protein 3 isoform X10 [Canis lupus familiaris]
MEEILRKLQKEASGSKYKAIKESCTWALETLGGVDTIVKIPPHLLREKCLLPLQLALESKNVKLAQHALAGIQKLLSEERFVSMETDSDEKQLLNQILNAVKVTPSLNEDLQVEVMKVLLCITYTPTFDLNGSAVLKIAELCLACHKAGRPEMHEMVKMSITKLLTALCLRAFPGDQGPGAFHKVCIETYICSCHQRSINTAVRATLSQMLSDLTLQLRQRQENTIIENPDVPQEFRNQGSTVESLCDDLVSVLTVLCEKLQAAINDQQQLQLLYLECVLSVLSSSSSSMHLHRGFTDLIWKNLCPALIVILGNPIHDKSITSAHSSSTGSGIESDSASPGVSDHGRGSGCSSTAPALSGPVARTIYYIAAELVRLVGSVDSMKPVLQSLYHRVLLYPPPQHRVEAIKIMKELLGSPQRLCDLAGPSSTESESRKRSISKRKSHLDLLKLIMDGMTEACIKGGIEACYAAVSCVCTLLGALDELSQGRGLSEGQVQLLLLRLEELKDGAEWSRDSVEINEADFRWQRRVLSSEHTPWEPGSERSPDISISVTTDTGQTTLEGALGRTTPDEHPEHPEHPKSSLKSPAAPESKEPPSKAPEPEAVDQPDVVQRSHTVAYPDITNFLSVDCRMRSFGSRYSESNFSVDDQDLSRTEFDSCDQYSMAAEKDSGRSDVSDIGSDNGSLADEEQTPRDCLGHRSLRTAALSLKLLKNQEADQHSARLFLQALESLLPRLLALPSVEEVDAALQNFASTFCSGMMHSPGFDGSGSLSLQMLMNADSLYTAAHCALLLNLKLSHGDYYRKRPTLASGMMKEFMKQVQTSGVLMVFSQAWIEELYHQVLERNMLGEAGYWGSPEDNSLPLITMLTDIDGLESSAIGGQLMASASTESPFTQGRRIDDSTVAGVAFARYILVGCWKNLIDTLSTPLTGRMAGSSKGLAFILGAEGIKEQNQKERDAICMSLDGLRKAARLSCALGVAANCASALAQMAAASCVQEEKEEKEVQEPSDAIAQVKLKVEQKLEQIGKLQGVWLHTAHVLCMDAILSVGLEMGSHNPDCWPHVFRVCEYVGTLEHTHFSDGTAQPPLTISQPQKASGGSGLLGDPECEGLAPEQNLEPESSLSTAPVIQPLSIQELVREGSRGRASDFRGGSLMTGSSAAKAVLTLSTQADRLFEDATDKLNLMALGGFLYQLKKASQSQLFHSVTDTVDYSLAMPGEVKSTHDRKSALHLFRLGDAMLRIVRSKSRPLFHVMRCWSLVAPHLVEAACHKERHVSQKAVSFIHDILTEVLTDWNEPPHFHFNEALFRPFERIMQLELCDEDVQDQVVTSIGELVEVCSTQIQSGWRPLFSALETVHSGNKSEVKEYLVGDYSMGKGQAPVFDVFEAFLNTDNIQVFANAATSYIMCLMKFVKGLGEVDCKEIGDCVPGPGATSPDLCLPALDYLRRCSQLLAKIYKMPLKPIFLSGRLASLPRRLQEQSASSEDGIESVLSDFDDDTGLIEVWIILLEQLTAAVSNCPRQHQPPTLDLLFELLRDVTKTPGPGFGIYAVVHLLLPVMTLWLRRSHKDHSYWDAASANFKHAIGLSCELVVEHIQSFIHSDIRYESMINTMLKDLFELLVACVAKPTETISRVGCSCIRYVLVTAGPVFTEEMWRLACCALQDAFSATLKPVKDLLGCFHSGTESFSGEGCQVRVAAPSSSPSAEAEYWRIRAMAQQVFMLDTQCSPKTPNNFDHAQSCQLIIELPPDEKPNGHTKKSVSFREIVVSLLSHQVLLQNLYDVLLEEFVKGPSPGEDKTGAAPEAKLAGFLRYISMQNLAVIFDLLLDSYRTAREFDTSPGLKCLLKKVSGIGGAANLYRQSAMSFNIYFHALVCAVLTNQEAITAEQVKKVLFEDDERSTDSSQQCSSEDEDIFEETAQVSPPRGREKRRWRARLPSLSVQPVSNADWVWLVKRLHKLCMELCTNYIQMHLDLESSVDEAPVFKSDPFFILPSFQSESSTPSTGGFSGKDTPSEDDRSQAQAQAQAHARDHAAEPGSLRAGGGGGDALLLPPRPPSPRVEKKDAGRRREWWESAGNRIYTMAADRTISKLMTEYKKRKQQHNLPAFPKEGKVEKKGEPLGARGQDSPLLQRPQHLVDQGQMRHSFSAGPELLRQEKRPRSGSTGSSLSVSVRDAEAQIQAWTNMVLTVLNQIQILPDQTFTALQPAVFPCISQLTCHVTDIRVRQAVREWLGRVGRVYDIIV